MRPCGAGACTHSLFMPSKGTGPAPSVCRLPVAAVERRLTLTGPAPSVCRLPIAAVERRLTLTADQRKQLCIAYTRAKSKRAQSKRAKAEAEAACKIAEARKAEAEAACKIADQLERQADEMRKELELQGPQAA